MNQRSSSFGAELKGYLKAGGGARQSRGREEIANRGFDDQRMQRHQRPLKYIAGRK
jgi:hypothetical protein